MCDRTRQSPGKLAEMACVVEVTAPKAGNVHPAASFEDVAWVDFVTSAAVCAPVLDRAAERGVGPTVLACVEATAEAVGSNTNLGSLLLLAPMCAVPDGEPLKEGVRRVLAALTPGDAADVYRGILRAGGPGRTDRPGGPGGLGAVPDADVRKAAPPSLPDAMRLAADRDAVARQYANGFADVLDTIAPRLCRGGEPLDRAIVGAHLEQMAREPDSLIRRKCGDDVAVESQRRAAAALEAGWPHAQRGTEQFTELDRWLRADANRRNPGTSADLIAAALYVALREGAVEAPVDWGRPLAFADE